MHDFRKIINVIAVAAGTAGLAMASPLLAQAASDQTIASAEPTYSDLADLADRAQLVVRARVKDHVTLPPERAPGLTPGFARLYVEAETLSLLAGSVPLGESLKYLVDVPLDAKGKAPKLKKREFLLFAKPVPGRAGELQLIDPQSQLGWSAPIEARLRPILAELVAPDSLPRIRGVRDALSVAGNLVGESETQIFLDTVSGDPVSITVLARPGMAPTWGVSGSELIDQAARPPVRDTVDWYRLACFLPQSLPQRANLSSDSASRARAQRDYAFVLAQLGPCVRNRN